MGAQGTATLDFGAFPGTSDASVDVATAGVVVTSAVEAWIVPTATADHSADEHMVETLKVFGLYLSDGTIQIRGFNTNQVMTPPNESSHLSRGSGAQAWTFPREPMPMIVGQWTVGWVWN